MNVYGNPNGFETGSPQQNGSHGVEGGSMNSVRFATIRFYIPLSWDFMGSFAQSKKEPIAPVPFDNQYDSFGCGGWI
jgi:hypothetical protein